MFSTATLSLLSLPLVSALIGWLTNWTAIKLLFHPRQPKTVLGVTFQGILPRRQTDIAVQLGRIVATDLLASNDLVAGLTNDTSRGFYREVISEQVESILETKLYQLLPASRLLLRSKRVEKIKNSITDEVMQLLPDLLARLTQPDSGALDVQRLVEERVRGLSTDRLERLLHDLLAKEFRFIEYLGAILGFIIGLIQMLWLGWLM